MSGWNDTVDYPVDKEFEPYTNLAIAVLKQAVIDSAHRDYYGRDATIWLTSRNDPDLQRWCDVAGRIYPPQPRPTIADTSHLGPRGRRIHTCSRQSDYGSLAETHRLNTSISPSSQHTPSDNFSNVNRNTSSAPSSATLPMTCAGDSAHDTTSLTHR
jgi:hypothetical protein